MAVLEKGNHVKVHVGPEPFEFSMEINGEPLRKVRSFRIIDGVNQVATVQVEFYASEIEADLHGYVVHEQPEQP